RKNETFVRISNLKSAAIAISLKPFFEYDITNKIYQNNDADLQQFKSRDGKVFANFNKNGHLLIPDIKNSVQDEIANLRKLTYIAGASGLSVITAETDNQYNK